MSLFESPETNQEVKFEDLVGDGKKYRDQDAVAKAIAEKDRFIAQIQNENAEMRKTMASGVTAQQILDRLDELKKTPTADVQPQTNVVEERVVEHKGLTEADIERVVAKREATRQAQTNIDMVKARLVEQHGPNYPQVLKSLADSMGVQPDYIENMAATAPQALLRLTETSRPQSVFTPPSSSSPTGFQPSGGGPQKRSYYKKIMDTDRNKYFTPAIQNQMYRDAMALKEEFQDVPD